MVTTLPLSTGAVSGWRSGPPGAPEVPAAPPGSQEPTSPGEWRARVGWKDQSAGQARGHFHLLLPGRGKALVWGPKPARRPSRHISTEAVTAASHGRHPARGLEKSPRRAGVSGGVPGTSEGGTCPPAWPAHRRLSPSRAHSQPRSPGPRGSQSSDSVSVTLCGAPLAATLTQRRRVAGHQCLPVCSPAAGVQGHAGTVICVPGVLWVDGRCCQ